MVLYRRLIRPGTMMSRALHIAIVLTVAVDVVLGCCWHHAHAGGSAGDLSVGVESTGCPCDHDGHRHESGSCDHDHSKEHGCGEHSCVFARSDAPDASDLFAALQDYVPVSQLPAIAASCWNMTLDRISSRSAPSAPLYLLNQVLLI